MMKATPKNLSEAFPFEGIRACFISRSDIARLPKGEQEKEWQTQEKAIRELMEDLIGIPVVSVGESERKK